MEQEEWMKIGQLAYPKECVLCNRTIPVHNVNSWQKMVRVQQDLIAYVYLHGSCYEELNAPAIKTPFTTRTVEDVREKKDELLYRYGNASYSGDAHMQYVISSALTMLEWLLNEEPAGYSHGWTPEWHKQYEKKKGLK